MVGIYFSGTGNAKYCIEQFVSAVKIEFAFQREFASFDELEVLWFDYVNWYNNVRIHGSLGYKTPVEFANCQ